MHNAAELGFLPDVDLAPRTTFGVPARARWFLGLSDRQALVGLRRGLGEDPPLILGGGSNILFTQDPERPVLGIELTGLEPRERPDGRIEVWAGAGENWHALTQYTVDKGWGGLENLSLIPGKVGAAPMQNIGAYGVEVKDTIAAVEVFDWKAVRFETLSASECGFGYRESIFKRAAKDRYVIVGVRFVLDPKAPLHLDYGSIREELEHQGVAEPDYRSVSKAVIAIRQSKLPDPAVLGNAGSFFKNPSVDAALAERLSLEFPTLPRYPQPDGRVKLAAGWLIEQTGWKGRRMGACGVHDRQALVLVNYGGAQGAEILKLARTVQAEVERRFGVALETEVNIL
ncbi:UDP-N-acetylmuramate dehydrogenase [bacterium]|nr:UDP-N-acetylmuramate dehydrogenase [bacterium]